MNRKIFQKVQQLTKKATKSAKQTAHSIKTRYHYELPNYKTWTNFASKWQHYAHRFQPDRSSLEALVTRFSKNEPKQNQSHQNPHTQPRKQPLNSQKKSGPYNQNQESASTFWKQKWTQAQKVASKTYDSLGSQLQKQKSQLQQRINQEDLERIRRESMNRISKASMSLKSGASSTLDSLQKQKDDLLNKAQDHLKSAKIDYTERWKQGATSAKDNTIKALRERINSSEQFIQEQKEKLSRLSKDRSGQMSENAEQLQKQLKQMISQAANAKADMLKKLINKIFWRIGLLLAIIAFAYGIGISVPRQVGEHLRFIRNEQKAGEKNQAQRSAIAQ